MGKTHSAAGMLFVAAGAPPIGSLLGFDFTPEQIAIGVGIGAVAGVLPDIDHPQSMITSGAIPGFNKLGPIAKGIGYILSIPPRIIGIPARATMNHRGGTHSFIFLLGWTFLAAPFYLLCAAAAAFILSLIYAPIAAIFPILPDFNLGAFVDWLIHILPEIMPLVSISVFLGYLSHLITDSMTNVPVPWPWPFSKKRISILPKGVRITTDSFAENFLIRPLILVLLVVALIFNVIIPIVEQVTGTESGAVTKAIKEDDSPDKKEPQKKKVSQEKKTSKEKRAEARRLRAQARKRQAEARRLQAQAKKEDREASQSQSSSYDDNPLKGLESSR